MATVLWGQRRGDVIYGSTDWRRRNITFGEPRLIVDNSAYFDVWSTVEISSQPGQVYVVTGKEGCDLGIQPFFGGSKPRFRAIA